MLRLVATVALVAVVTVAVIGSGSVGRGRQLSDTGPSHGLVALLALWTSNLGENVELIEKRFDPFLRIWSLTLASLHFRYGSAGPEPASNVPVPTAQRDGIPMIPCGLMGTLVPATAEGQPDVAAMSTLGNVLGAFSDPDNGIQAGDWLPGEEPAAYIKEKLEWGGTFGEGLSAWPYNRNIVQRPGEAELGWGTEFPADDPFSAFRFSDLALEQFTFEGVGQHRIQRLPPNDTHAPEEAYYAVYLSAMDIGDEYLKEGFAPLGADAYFDSSGHILGIWRQGRLYTPDEHPGTAQKCVTISGRVRKCEGGWQDGWLHAKLAFRGSMMAMVTFVDHLQGLHMTVVNAMHIACEERLPSWHPLRRMVTPFFYNAFGVNYNAATVLVNEEGMVPHALGLTDAGITKIFEYGNATSLGWATIPQRKAAKGVDTVTLPLDEDGADYYQILWTYVHSYLELYYGPFEAVVDGEYDAPAVDDACAMDFATVEFYERLASYAPHSDLPPISCANLLNVMATFFYYSSATHRHVGSIAGEVEDPCFAPWAWRPGDLCGPPRTFMSQAEIMSATGYEEQVRIMDDYTHLYDDEVAKQLWRDLTTSLGALQTVVDQRNEVRLSEGKLAFKVFEPEMIETAVGI